MSRSFLVFVLLSIFVILALNVEALVAPGPGPSVLPLPVDAPRSPQLLNGSRAGEYRNMSVARIGGDIPDYQCDGTAYGTQLLSQSCYHALEIMPGGGNEYMFGQGRSTSIIPTPWRVSSPDGYCAIQIQLREDLWYTGLDTATFKELREGAMAVFAGCLVKERVGGVSRYHGAKSRLEVIVESYDPRNVRCGSRSNPGPVRGSCTHVIERTFPSKTVFTFGRKGEEGVTMPLPFRSQSPRKECMMTVNTIGGTDRASWYDLYKAVIAVDMICVRNSPAMNGIITGVGESGQLSISLNRESPVVIEAGGRGGYRDDIETA